MRILKWTLGVYGGIGEFVAHVLYPIRQQLPNCNFGSILQQTYCVTGIPAAIQNPILWYHLSVHAVLAVAVGLLLMPKKWRERIHID